MIRPRLFRCFLGREAARALAQHRDGPDSFRCLLGASGGPRWLGLSGLDRACFRFLRCRPPTAERLPLLGASSGAWRMAALASDEDGQTYNELEEAYLQQSYTGRPSPDEVSQTCRAYLSEVFTPSRQRQALSNPRFQVCLTSAVIAREHPERLHLTALLSALILLNLADRRLLGWGVERCLFSAGPLREGSPLAHPSAWSDLPTRRVELDEGNFLEAILASGSIPLVLAGVASLPGAGPGHHLDGGLVDYHFELEHSGAVLYPHFSTHPIPGWLDRFVPHRQISQKARSQLCLIVPSPEQLARYPGGTFPGRDDFTRWSNRERIARWRQVVQANQAMQKELTACLEAGELSRIAFSLEGAL